MLIHQLALIRLHIKQTSTSEFVIFCLRNSCIQFLYNIQELQTWNNNLCFHFCWHLLYTIVNQPDCAVCCGMMRQFSCPHEWALEDPDVTYVHHLNTNSGSTFGSGLEAIVGPCVITECLGTVRYADFLERTLSLLLEDILLNICKGM
jgi:hypothetical protein